MTEIDSAFVEAEIKEHHAALIRQKVAHPKGGDLVFWKFDPFLEMLHTAPSLGIEH
jgi:hypothetical protein